MNHDITDAIENLAAALEAKGSPEFLVWGTASLGSRLGLVTAIAPGGDSLEAIIEIGEMWAEMVAERLDEEPYDQRETLKAAYRVVQKVVDSVRLHGLAKDQRAPLRA